MELEEQSVPQLPIAIVDEMKGARNHIAHLAKEQAQALATYYGGDLLLDHITPYSTLEKPEKLKRRREETILHHEDFVKEISRRYTETIFSGTKVVRVTGIQELDDYLSEEYADFFVNEVAEPSYYLPELYVYIGPRLSLPGEVLSTWLESQGWGKPTTILGASIRNVKLNKSRQPVYLSIPGEIGKQKVLRIYDSENVYVYNDSDHGEFIESYPHGCKGIPFVRVCWQDNKALGNIGHSYLSDVIRKSLGLLCYISIFIESTTLHLSSSKLFASEQDAESIRKYGLGATDIVEIDSSADSVKPFYLTVPVAETEKMIDIIWTKIPESIYRSARLRYKASGDQSSGRAKFIDMQPELRAVSRIAKQLATVDKMICDRIFSTFENPPSFTTYEFPSTFNVKTTEEYLSELAIIGRDIAGSNLPQSEKGMKEHMKKFYSELFRDQPDIAKDIHKELDSWSLINAEPTTRIESDFPPKMVKVMEQNPKFRSRKDMP